MAFHELGDGDHAKVLVHAFTLVSDVVVKISFEARLPAGFHRMTPLKSDATWSSVQHSFCFKASWASAELGLGPFCGSSISMASSLVAVVEAAAG